MSRVINIFSLDVNEIVFNINDNPWLTNTNNNPVTSSSLHEASNNTNNELLGGTNNSCWCPSTTLQKILQQLYNDDYAQFPCVPCAYCSRLLYPNSIKWITRDEHTLILLNYPFQIHLLFLILTIHQKLQYAVVVKLNLIIDQVAGLL